MLFSFRSFFIFVCILLLLIVGCGGGGGYSPEELAKGRIVIEKQHYQKTLFFEDPNLNLIWDLRRGNFDNDSDEEILVVGSNGVRLLTLEGKLKNSIPFELKNLYDIRVVDIDNNGKYEFLSSGLWGTPSAVLLDNKGKVIWKYNRKSAYSPVAGDIDGNEMKETMMPYYKGKSGGGLLVLDAKGNLLKDIEGYLNDHIEIADLNGDGKDEIVYWSEQEESLIVQEANGKILYHIEPQLENFTFSITDWVEGSPAHILLVGSEKMQILNIEGNPLVTLNTPYSSYSYKRPNGSLLRMNQDDKNPYGYLSLIGGRGGWHRTVLYINSLSGELLYQEVIEGDCNSLLAFDDAKTKSGSFLVGGRNRIWLYSPLE